MKVRDLIYVGYLYEIFLNGHIENQIEDVDAENDEEAQKKVKQVAVEREFRFEKIEMVNFYSTNQNLLFNLLIIRILLMDL
jgi:hypothetical protein